MKMDPIDMSKVADDSATEISPPALDMAIGAVVLAGGVGLVAYAAGFSAMIPNTVIGPGLLLEICGAVFVLTGAAIGLSGFRLRRVGPMPSAGMFALLVPALLAAILILTPMLGFPVVGAVATMLYIRASGAGWGGAVVAAAVLTAAVYLAFTQIMRVPLPLGTLFQ